LERISENQILDLLYNINRKVEELFDVKKRMEGTTSVFET
jgi:hypothetical protein